jgi:hypothetical protein
VDGRISVEYARTGIKLAFRVLDVPQIQWMHWHDGLKKEVPCFREQCKICPLPGRRKGFAPCIGRQSQMRGLSREQKPLFRDVVYFVAELTSNALDRLQPADFDDCVYVMTRRTAGGPLVIERQVSVPDYTMPRSFDVRPIVAKMWGIESWPDSQERSEVAGDDAPLLLPLARRAQ